MFLFPICTLLLLPLHHLWHSSIASAEPVQVTERFLLTPQSTQSPAVGAEARPVPGMDVGAGPPLLGSTEVLCGCVALSCTSRLLHFQPSLFIPSNWSLLWFLALCLVPLSCFVQALWGFFLRTLLKVNFCRVTCGEEKRIRDVNLYQTGMWAALMGNDTDFMDITSISLYWSCSAAKLLLYPRFIWP